MQATRPRFLSTDAQYSIRGKMNAADCFEMEWIAPSAASGVWDCAGFSARFAGEPKDTCITGRAQVPSHIGSRATPPKLALHQT
jgi:hypothetical protein